MGMENKFNLLRDLPEDADINHRWTQLKEMYGEVGEDCVGQEKKSRPAPRSEERRVGRESRSGRTP